MTEGNLEWNVLPRCPQVICICLKVLLNEWIFIGKTDAEAEAQILWPPDVKSWLIGKDSDAGKDWGLEKKGATEDEMVG